MRIRKSRYLSYRYRPDSQSHHAGCPRPLVVLESRKRIAQFQRNKPKNKRTEAMKRRHEMRACIAAAETPPPEPPHAPARSSEIKSGSTRPQRTQQHMVGASDSVSSSCWQVKRREKNPNLPAGQTEEAILWNRASREAEISAAEHDEAERYSASSSPTDQRRAAGGDFALFLHPSLPPRSR